jgi:hypothetical protein
VNRCCELAPARPRSSTHLLARLPFYILSTDRLASDAHGALTV